jgi:hypothetical protein
MVSSPCLAGVPDDGPAGRGGGFGAMTKPLAAAPAVVRHRLAIGRDADLPATEVGMHQTPQPLRIAVGVQPLGHSRPAARGDAEDHCGAAGVVPRMRLRQRTNSAIRMTMGMGMPSKSSISERMGMSWKWQRWRDGNGNGEGEGGRQAGAQGPAAQRDDQSAAALTMVMGALRVEGVERSMLGVGPRAARRMRRLRAVGGDGVVTAAARAALPAA